MILTKDKHCGRVAIVGMVMVQTYDITEEQPPTQCVCVCVCVCVRVRVFVLMTVYGMSWSE